jgi:hypothetical protein
LNGKFIGKKPVVVMLHIRKEQRKQLKKLIPDSLSPGDEFSLQQPSLGFPSSSPSMFYSQNNPHNAILPLPPNCGKKHISAYYSRQSQSQSQSESQYDPTTTSADNHLFEEETPRLYGPTPDENKKDNILHLDANSLLLQQWQQQKKHQHDHHLRHQQQLTKQQTLVQQKHQQQMQRLQRKQMQMQMQQEYGSGENNYDMYSEVDENSRRISLPVRLTTTAWLTSIASLSFFLKQSYSDSNVI